VVVGVSGLAYPKHVSEELDLLSRALGEARRVFLFVDYGGTLVSGLPGSRTRPTPEVLRRLAQLSRVESFSVFVVSGRTVDELDELLGVEGVGLVGQRGFEIRRADGPTVHPVDPDVVGGLLHHLELDAHGSLEGCPGVRLENRGFALALHLSGCEPEVAGRASERFVALVSRLDAARRLEVLYDGDVVEARIAGWHKGNAVSRILEDVTVEDCLAIYIGDDVTDEDAFEALISWAAIEDRDLPWFLADPDEEEPPPHALPILVAAKPRPTLASLFVRGPREVQEFLSSLAAIASALL